MNIMPNEQQSDRFKMAKETFTKAAEKPKRDFGTWMGILTLAGMGLICTGGAVGGIYLAAVSFATQPAAAAGGLIMSAAMGFVLPKISSALRDQFTGPQAATPSAPKQMEPAR